MEVSGPPHLVGRDDELTLVAGLVDGVRQGKGATLLVEGEAGVGKTALVAGSTAAARRAGVQVLRGGGHAFESTRPFGPVADALDLRPGSGDPRRAAVGRLLVGDVWRLPSRSAGRPPDVRHRVIGEVLEILRHARESAPVLLVIEDLHWADSSTLLAFRAMAYRLADVPVLLVGTLRPAPRSGRLARLVGEVLHDGATALVLEPLHGDDVGALVRSEVGGEAGPNLVRLVAKAGGNPLWIVEMLRTLSGGGALRWSGASVDVASPEVPDSLGELVQHRLSDLSPATSDLLRVASVLGDAVSVRDLATVTGRRIFELSPALTEAFESRLLGERGDAVVFRHQLVQEAVYRQIPGPVRRAMHREAAATLAQDGAPLTTVAGHLMLGAEHGDRQAVSLLREAAREAAARAPSVAVQLLRRADQLLAPGADERDVVTAELAEALLQAGDVADAARTAEAVLARPHRADVDVPLRLSLISALSLQNRPAELVDRAEALLAQSSDLAGPERSLVLTQASYGRIFSGDVRAGELTARRGLETAERCGDVGGTVWSLGALSVALKNLGRYADAVGCAERAVDLAFTAPGTEGRGRHPHFFLAMALSDSDRWQQAADAFGVVLREYGELGTAWLLPDTLLMAAERRFLVGEWDDALTQIDAGLRAATDHGTPISVPIAHACRAVIATARGELQSAAGILAATRGDLDETAYRYGDGAVAWASALLAEARGERLAAYRILLRQWHDDVARGLGYDQRCLAPPLVRLGIAVGKPAVAGDVAAWSEGVAVLAPGVPSVQSAALRCRGLVEQDPDRLLLAVEYARAGGRFLDHAAACEDAAAVLVARDRPADATAMLQEAYERYEAAGAQLWSARAASGLRRLGVRLGARGGRRRPQTGWMSLTPTERAVSSLVAEGLTNAEVAERLFISRHTVNTHLRHVFQKLSVTTRTGLAARVPSDVV